LFVITKSNFGGAQRYVYDLATHLPRKRYEVAVALGGTGGHSAQLGSLHHKLALAGIRTIPIKHFMRDVSFIEDLRVFGELVTLFLDEKPDIVHVTSSKAGGLGALAARIARTPRIVFTSHGLAYDESWRPRWQRTFILMASWLTMLLANCTIQISEDTCRRARSLPFLSKKVALVYNGIGQPTSCDRATARSELTASLGTAVSAHEPWVGCVRGWTNSDKVSASG